jgi:hypothetical protein
MDYLTEYEKKSSGNQDSWTSLIETLFIKKYIICRLLLQQTVTSLYASIYR